MLGMDDGLVLWTIGHSNRTLTAFLDLLKTHGLTRIVDVRTVPRSRHNPQFGRDVLPASLAGAGIAYTHMPEIGGLRRPRPDSPNTGWRHAGFRGFADHMQTPQFEAAIARVIDLARADRLALMCAEAVPWRCHRNLIADALVVRGVQVEEILGPEPARVHVLTPWAKVAGHRLTYPPSEDSSPGERGDPGEESGVASPGGLRRPTTAAAAPDGVNAPGRPARPFRSKRRPAEQGRLFPDE